jgi:hypothetical protein
VARPLLLRGTQSVKIIFWLLSTHSNLTISL